MFPEYGRRTASAGTAGGETAKPVFWYGVLNRPISTPCHLAPASVAVAGEHGRELLAGIEELGGESAMFAGGTDVDRHRLLLAGGEGGGLVRAADRKVQAEDL
ncbi:hypothetical protein OHT76_38080 [Streptomyces sp. NBC_00287]|uniref:hypothetical protein n=1 Tax=Streptomyces sp. NBC_00287 TaxID=2975702 RepID=UPI002E2D72B6|nr:hypothetical protein [Streptomyces sp. NBC_00287]